MKELFTLEGKKIKITLCQTANEYIKVTMSHYIITGRLNLAHTLKDPRK